MTEGFTSYMMWYELLIIMSVSGFVLGLIVLIVYLNNRNKKEVENVRECRKQDTIQ